jgi:hypothetical protein
MKLRSRRRPPGTAHAWLAVLLVVFAGACKKTPPVVAPASDVRPPPPPPRAELPARGVGMDDPFARMAAETVKLLNGGYKALRGKRYPEAAAAFAAVVAALPDYTPARFQQLRAAALDGRFADVPDIWRELLARDFVGYAGRLDKAPELEPLRASAVAPRLRDIQEAIAPAYAAGLSTGVLFVARTHAAEAPKLDATGVAKARLTQEVYHFDLSTGRYRRLTDTGGRVFAVAVSPGGKSLALLVTPALARLPDGRLAFRDPEGAVVNLATLQLTGPAPLGAVGFSAHQISLCQSKAGEPLWLAAAPSGVDTTAYAFDSTGAALVRVEGQGEACAAGDETQATPETVRHLGPDDPDAHPSDNGDRLQIAGAGKPLRLIRPVNPASIVWSPGRKRISYAGLLDPCKVKREGAASKTTRNELYVWDFETKRAQRIASAVSKFDSRWIDDDHLVYEGGVGGSGRLFVYDARAGTSAPLKTRVGAGLYGYPMIACDDEHEDDAPGEAMPPDMPDDDPAE